MKEKLFSISEKLEMVVKYGAIVWLLIETIKFFSEGLKKINLSNDEPTTKATTTEE